MVKRGKTLERKAAQEEVPDRGRAKSGLGRAGAQCAGWAAPGLLHHQHPRCRPCPEQLNRIFLHQNSLQFSARGRRIGEKKKQHT